LLAGEAKASMFILKACPRCRGDLYSSFDDDLTCMQCGKDVTATERERILAHIKPVAASKQPAAV
jgi:uncharacterized protein (DUF983 family)